MRQFTIVFEAAATGVDAYVPSIRECESWGHTEDEALHVLLHRLAFFLNIEAGFKHSIDFMRQEEGKRYYKLMLR